jgi:hypothetical protein
MLGRPVDYPFIYLFLRITQYNGDIHNARTLIPMNTRVQILEIDEVTTDVSLSMRMSPTTKNTKKF